MDGKTIGTGIAAVATNVVAIVIPELLPSDPDTKNIVLYGGLVLSAALYALAALFWWKGQKRPDHEIAARLSRGIVEAINDYKANSASIADWQDRDAGLRQSDTASRRLLERYRTDFQSEVIAFLRRLKAQGRDVDRVLSTAEHPTNPLGVEELARELGAIAYDR